MARKDIHIDGKKTQFTSQNQPENRGRPPGVQNSKTRLLRFLALQMKGKNPVTKEEEEFSVLEMGDLKQIERMLNGDLYAYREILDRLEGKSRQETDLNINADVNVGLLSDADQSKVEKLLKAINGGNAGNKDTSD